MSLAKMARSMRRPSTPLGLRYGVSTTLQQLRNAQDLQRLAEWSDAYDDAAFDLVSARPSDAPWRRSRVVMGIVVEPTVAWTRLALDERWRSLRDTLPNVVLGTRTLRDEPPAFHIVGGTLDARARLTLTLGVEPVDEGAPGSGLHWFGDRRHALRQLAKLLERRSDVAPPVLDLLDASGDAALVAADAMEASGQPRLARLARWLVSSDPRRPDEMPAIKLHDHLPPRYGHRADTAAISARQRGHPLHWPADRDDTVRDLLETLTGRAVTYSVACTMPPALDQLAADRHQLHSALQARAATPGMDGCWGLDQRAWSGGEVWPVWAQAWGMHTDAEQADILTELGMSPGDPATRTASFYGWVAKRVLTAHRHALLEADLWRASGPMSVARCRALQRSADIAFPPFLSWFLQTISAGHVHEDHDVRWLAANPWQVEGHSGIPDVIAGIDIERVVDTIRTVTTPGGPASAFAHADDAPATPGPVGPLLRLAGQHRPDRWGYGLLVGRGPFAGHVVLVQHWPPAGCWAHRISLASYLTTIAFALHGLPDGFNSPERSSVIPGA